MKNDELNQKNDELFTELKKYSPNTQEYQNLVNQIVKNNVALVTHVAKKFFPNVKGSTLSNDDLIAEGYFWLLRAIKSFAPEKAVPFANFAARCIDNGIIVRLRKEQKHKDVSSLEDNFVTGNDDYAVKFADVLASPVNMEDDIVEKEEQQRQMAWLRKNLNLLTPLQKQVLTAKYLSGEKKLSNAALAKRINCSFQNISSINNKAIANLRKMYQEFNTEKGLTSEGAIGKEELKNLILTGLTPQQKKFMLCKFYSGTPKTNQQVAQEIKSTEGTVKTTIFQATKKLRTLCNRVQDKKHLTEEAIRNILQSRIEEKNKEY